MITNNEKLKLSSLYESIGKRTINHYQLNWRKHKTDNLTPYILDTSVDGKYRLIELIENNHSSYRGIIFLISPDELPSVENLITSMNNLIELHLQKIKLLKEHLISSIDSHLNR